MMAHTSCLLGCEKIAGRGLEKIEHGLVLERG
jgi:hypothetical protein